MRYLLSFPNALNEKAARTVAFVVMVVSAVRCRLTISE
jgi:hypothetical protein